MTLAQKMKRKEEMRRSPRVKLYTPLRYQVRGENLTENFLTDDVSARGIGFTSNKFIAPRTIVMLEFSVLSRAIRPVGRVSWSETLPHSDRFRAGVEFIEIDPGERNFLSDYVNIHL